MILFELSLDNNIEIINDNGQVVEGNTYKTLKECLNEIYLRNLTGIDDVYDNLTVGIIVGMHKTILDCQYILSNWEKGFDFSKESDIIEVRDELICWIDTLKSFLSDTF